VLPSPFLTYTHTRTHTQAIAEDGGRTHGAGPDYAVQNPLQA